MEAGIGKQGLVPPSQVCVCAVSQLLFQSRGVQGSGSAHAALHNSRALVHRDPCGTGLGVGFGALSPSGNAAGLLVG